MSFVLKEQGEEKELKMKMEKQSAIILLMRKFKFINTLCNWIFIQYKSLKCSLNIKNR